MFIEQLLFLSLEKFTIGRTSDRASFPHPFFEIFDTSARYSHRCLWRIACSDHHGPPACDNPSTTHKERLIFQLSWQHIWVGIANRSTRFCKLPICALPVERLIQLRFFAIIRDAVWQARSGYGTVCALKSYIHRPKTMARMEKVAEYQNSHEMRTLGREQLGLFI